MSPKTLFTVQVNVAPAVEDDWSKWYDEVHLPDILKVPGFLSGRRYRAVEGATKYLTLYELQDVRAFYSEEFNRARGWGRFAPDVTDRSIHVYEAIR